METPDGIKEPEVLAWEAVFYQGAFAAIYSPLTKEELKDAVEYASEQKIQMIVRAQMGNKIDWDFARMFAAESGAITNGDLIERLRNFYNSTLEGDMGKPSWESHRAAIQEILEKFPEEEGTD